MFPDWTNLTPDRGQYCSNLPYPSPPLSQGGQFNPWQTEDSWSAIASDTPTSSHNGPLPLPFTGEQLDNRLTSGQQLDNRLTSGQQLDKLLINRAQVNCRLTTGQQLLPNEGRAAYHNKMVIAGYSGVHFILIDSSKPFRARKYVKYIYIQGWFIRSLAKNRLDWQCITDTW